MNIDEQYPSKYLSASDIPEDGDLVLTIKSVAVETVGQGEKAESKPIVYFEELKKGLLCNKTNKETIKGLYTRETDNWIGKKIALFAAEVDYQGKQVMGIRVRMRAPKAATASAPNGNGAAPTNSATIWKAWYKAAADAKVAGLPVPDLDDAANDAEVLAATKALKDKIADATF